MNAHTPEEIATWTVRYLDHDLDDEGVRRLSEAIARDPEARATYEAISGHAFHLADPLFWAESAAPAVVDFPQPKRGRLLRFVRPLAIAATVALATWLGLAGYRHASKPEPIGQLTAYEGAAVLMVDEGGTLRQRVTEGRTMPVFADQRLRLFSPVASAEFVYADGTRLSFSGVSDVLFTTSETGGKSLNVATGQVAADVARQPAGRPLEIITPTSTAEVLGTTLEFTADAEATSLAVTSGLVAVEGAGDRVEVAAGEEVRTTRTSESPRKVSRTDKLHDTWDARFTPEEFSQWHCGKQLPDGSVLAHPRPGTPYDWFTIASYNAWGRGEHSFFEIHADSVIHLRLKMDRPGPFGLMLSCRAVDRERKRGGNAFFGDALSRKIEGLQPGEWVTVSLPLAEFDRIERGKGKRPTREGDLAGLAAYYVHLSTRTEDRGLAVERIWVTRGGL